MVEYMRIINKLILIFTIFNFTSCFGEGIKMNRVFINEKEFKQYILDNLNKQYGIEFETTTYLNDKTPLFTLKKDYSGFTGNVKPKCCNTEQEKLLHSYYTVCNSIRTFDTQAHVYMFEEQLRNDVNKILKNNGIQYDILEFRGMSRSINKWSKDSLYENYKTSKDFETWIYIRIDRDISENDYSKLILPMVKKIYTLLEPMYNVTLTFYIDEYVQDVIVGGGGSSQQIREVLKNPDVVWLDLSKFKNYLEWTKEDIESEINIVDENLFITKWKKANGIE